MQPHQCLQQLIVYMGLYGTLPYVTDSASLWLAKACVVPAGLYGCLVWSSGFLSEGDVFDVSYLL